VATGKETGPASLFLFDPGAMTGEQAWKIVERVPLDANIAQRFRKCGGACCRTGKGHGPYWFAEYHRAGDKKFVCRYIGGEARLAVVRAAHDLVRAELDAAELAVRPELEALSALLSRAFARPRQLVRAVRKAVDVPRLVEVGGKSK
jgi:hypothetical protein